MTIKKVHDIQPEKFEFTKYNLEVVENILKKYPDKNKKSAVMPLLFLAQQQNDNWIPLSALKYIGNFLSMPYIKVYEIATFYSMYNLAPFGKYFVQVCTTSPCLIRGADKLIKVCKEKISSKEVFKIPIAHAEGCYFADEKTLQEIIDNKQIIFKYCDKNGEINITASQCKDFVEVNVIPSMKIMVNFGNGAAGPTFDLLELALSKIRVARFVDR